MSFLTCCLQTLVSSRKNFRCCYGHRDGSMERGEKKIKRPRMLAAFGNFSDTTGVGKYSGISVALRCRWSRGLRSRCRLRARGLRRCRTSGGSRHARLRVVGFDDRFGDIDFVTVVPQHGTLRPRLGGIDNHAKTVFLRVLYVAVEGLLLSFDLLQQGFMRIRI